MAVAGLELVAMKVLPQTRQMIKVLAAEQGREMWELVMDLAHAEWKRTKGDTPPPAIKVENRP